VSSHLQTQYARAGDKGVAPIYTATAFDAVGVMAAAMKKVGYNAVAAREQIVKLKGYVGATGSLQFNSAGQVSMPVQIDQVQNDKFVTIQK
jgi:ABC-type branched-subunit amino acid transport system substrate-binding protein